MQAGKVQPGRVRPSKLQMTHARLVQAKDELKNKSPNEAHPINPARHPNFLGAVRSAQGLVERETERQKERAELLTCVSCGEISVRRAVEDLKRLKVEELGLYCIPVELEKVIGMSDDELVKLLPDSGQEIGTQSYRVECLRQGAARILFSLDDSSFKWLSTRYLVPSLIKSDGILRGFLTFQGKQKLAKFIRNLGRFNCFDEDTKDLSTCRRNFDNCVKSLFALATEREDLNGRIDSKFILSCLLGNSHLKETSNEQDQKNVARQQKLILAVLRNAPQDDKYISTVGLDTAVEIFKSAATHVVYDEALELLFDGFNIDRVKAVKLVREIALDTSRDYWQKAELQESDDFNKCFYRAYRMRRMHALETYLKLKPFEHYSRSSQSKIQLELKELLHEKDPRIVNKACKLLSARSLCQEAGEILLMNTILDQIEQGEPSLPFLCIANMAKYKNHPDYLDILLELFSRDIDLRKAFQRIHELEIFLVNEYEKDHEYGLAQYSLQQANMLDTIDNLLIVLLPYIAHSTEPTVPEEDILMNNVRDLVELACETRQQKGRAHYDRWVCKYFGGKGDPKAAELYAALAGRSNLESIDETIDGTFAGKNLNELVDRFQPSEK